MKKLLAIAVAVAILAAGGSAFAQGKVWKDLSWWGKSGATPAPVKDCTRSGYWWWPTAPKANADDKELWGNRGVVYAQFKPEPPKKDKTIVEPPKTKVEPPTRTKPIFNHVLFDFDKAVLKPEGKAETDKVVAALKANPKDTCIVEGHTCNIGDEKYNEGLGQRRADAVKKYMVEQGVDAARLTSKSFGETKPAVPNDTPANRKLNRRAMFDITIIN